jgi:pyruvate/2-oxoglutarate dehydrogenase complex dihydrolipoamide dehydrogenase (E3) component
MTQQYDAIIIGAGQAGGPLAGALARSGWKTALIEREHVGGTCINEGCTPTKTMVASARVAHLARRGADYGVLHGDVSVDMEVVRRRKRAIVESFRGGSQKRLESAPGLNLIFAEASFEGPMQVRAGDALLTASRAIVVNTGTRASRPAIPGLDAVAALDNRSIMELDTVPEHLIVLGGGYIGLEFGQMFRRFGSRVTIVQSNARLLPREDDDVTDAIADILREDGIRIITGARALRADAPATLTVSVAEAEPGAERRLEGSHLLVATGRTPNTDRLNLSAAGIETDAHGFIRANDRLETSAPGVFAAGDVKGGPAFTHISYDDFRILRARLLEAMPASIAGRPVPYTVYIDPQLGRIGLTEREALAQGLKFRVAKMPMTHVARALETDETRGFMKALVDDGGQILGAAVLGIEGGEIATIVQIAMMGKLPYTALRDAIFSHPTLAESLNNLFAGM